MPAGHAIEARVYAEDPRSGFLPSTGKLWALHLPEGDVRVDTGVESGGEVTGFYDPMIAKIIAHGATRDEALDKLSDALSRTIVAGPRTNTAFLKALCNAEGFRKGDFDTGFIERNLAALGAVEQPLDALAVAAAAIRLTEKLSWQIDPASTLGDSENIPAMDPWSVADAFSLCGNNKVQVLVSSGGQRLHVTLADKGEQTYGVALPGRDFAADVAVEWSPEIGLDHIRGLHDSAVVDTDESVLVIRNGRQTEVTLFDALDVDFESLDVPAGGALIKAPMHGKLIALYVQPGDVVQKGARLAVVEAMKMEHALTAPRDGVVAEVAGHVGQQVSQGAKLIVISELADAAAS